MLGVIGSQTNGFGLECLAQIFFFSLHLDRLYLLEINLLGDALLKLFTGTLCLIWTYRFTGYAFLFDSMSLNKANGTGPEYRMLNKTSLSWWPIEVLVSSHDEADFSSDI